MKASLLFSISIKDKLEKCTFVMKSHFKLKCPQSPLSLDCLPHVQKQRFFESFYERILPMLKPSFGLIEIDLLCSKQRFFLRNDRHASKAEKLSLFSGNYDAGDRFATLDPPFTKDSIYSRTWSHSRAKMQAFLTLVRTLASPDLP